MNTSPLKKIYELPLGFANFSNTELYMMISGFLHCGQIESSECFYEHLYISFRDVFQTNRKVEIIHFVLISEDVYDTSKAFIGFGYIEMYTGAVYYSKIATHYSDVYKDAIEIDFEKIDKNYELKINRYVFPIFSFTKNFGGLISKKASEELSTNPLAGLYQATPIPDDFKIRIHNHPYNQFNGEYYLIARPKKSEDNDTAEVINYPTLIGGGDKIQFEYIDTYTYWDFCKGLGEYPQQAIRTQ